MHKNNIVILGSGLLAKELLNQTDWACVSRLRNNIDFNKTDWYQHLSPYITIINCIANTDTYSQEREEHWNTNYTGVMNLVDYCHEHNKKLVHISTDYIYSGSKENAIEEDVPVHNRTWYAYTKLLGDAYVQARAKKYLLIRTSFKPNPFPYPNAILTQVGNFDYVDIISGLIIQLVSKGACGVFNVGTEKKTIYDLAIQTNPKVAPSNEVLNDFMPRNVTMDISKMENLLNDD